MSMTNRYSIYTIRTCKRLELEASQLGAHQQRAATLTDYTHRKSACALLSSGLSTPPGSLMMHVVIEFDTSDSTVTVTVTVTVSPNTTRMRRRRRICSGPAQ